MVQKKTRAKSNNKRFRKGKQSINHKSFLKYKNAIIKIVAWAIVAFFIGFIIWVNRTGLWKSDEHYNLAYTSVDGQTTGVILIDPTNEQAIIFKLPPQGIVKVVFGYGEYKIKSIHRLGKLEKLDLILLQKSLQELFGLYIHTAIEIEEAVKGHEKDWLTDLSQRATQEAIKGKIPLKDTLKLVGTVGAIRQDKIDVVDIQNSRLVRSKTESDNSISYVFDQARLDGYLSNNLSNLSISKEALKVAIINTVGEPGLASQASRILTNSGVDVVSISDNQDNLSQTKVIISSKELSNSLTYHLIKLIFINSDIEIGDTNQQRSDVVVFLGQDYFNYFNQKPDK